MVHFVPAYNFTRQNVQTIEQPTACTTAPPDRFLSALMSNCIEVRDLKNNAEVLFTFPTVDEAVQICYSLNGDYVATLETKFHRQNKEINFVRVYINWNNIATLQQSKMTNSGVSLGSSECGMVQPMRARIAGRVTPSSNQSDKGSLEMIEIPVSRNPHAIACCPITGNLLILSNNILNIHKFKVKSHDISKMKFIDFEDTGLRIELTFEPSKIEICENYIAAMNRDSMQLFKIYKTIGKENSHNIKKNNTEVPLRYNSDPIDYAQLLKEEMSINSKEKITINLASIVKENSVVHKHNPSTSYDKGMKVTISTNSLENTLSQYRVINLIQLRALPILIENKKNDNPNQFRTFILKPLYIEEMFNKLKKEIDDDNVFCSDYSKCLNSVSCMVATKKEGYLFQFEDPYNSDSIDNCIAIYSFKSTVFQLVMEDYILHALTENGLESYTLRIGHKLCHSFRDIDNINVACPPISDGIYLIGMKPFLGVEQILLSNSYLLLLANADMSPTHSVASNSSSNAVYWTLYSLELPTPETIFNDILIEANHFRFSFPSTYLHLINEAHMISRAALLLKKWVISNDNYRLVIRHEKNMDDIVELYRKSCALLGDHFIMCMNEELYSLAIPYYRMARIQAVEVIKRVKKLQDQSNSQFTKGLVYYLKHIMSDLKSGHDTDKLFTPILKQNFLDELLILLETQRFEDLPSIILKSKILQEYSTDKLIHLLTKKIKGDFPKQAEKSLALCILYIQKNNFDQARHHLRNIEVDNLYQLLLDHWEVIFDQNPNQQGTKGMTNFSELGNLIISHYTDRFAELLVNLVLKKNVMRLSRLIKIFLGYLPSSVGTEQNTATFLLQRTLEGYFEEFFSKPENICPSKFSQEKASIEAMKLLVRSYLSQLQILQLKDEIHKMEKVEGVSPRNETTGLEYSEKDQDSNLLKSYQTDDVIFDDKNNSKSEDVYLFSQYRHEYLKKMPPFQVEIVSKMYSMCVENYQKNEETAANEEADVVLAKLQAILCSAMTSQSINAEVNAFLALKPNLRGKDSIQSIVLSNMDATQLLVECCPQCLPQFGKDRFTKADEWQYLIASLQQKILKLSQDDNLNRICFFYKKTLKDTLTQLATSMALEELMNVFPQRFCIDTANYSAQQCNGMDKERKSKHTLKNENVPIDNLDYSDHDLDIMNEIQNYEPYIVICKETMHANLIKELIVKTGKELLLNLSF